MSWYQIHHGVLDEAKTAVVAQRARCRRGDALAVWVLLHDYACIARPRGSVAGVDAETLAVALGFETALVEEILRALHEKELITAENKIAGWHKRQNLSTPRTRAFRARQKKAARDAESDEARRARLQKEMLARRHRRPI